MAKHMYLHTSKIPAIVFAVFLLFSCGGNEAEPTVSLIEPVLYRSERIRTTIDPNLPMIAVTFDDGPHSERTEQILDTLEGTDARVTFFVLGENFHGNEDIIRRAFEMGHEIVGHTYAHYDLQLEPRETVIYEMQKSFYMIYELLGYSPRLFRPPYGHMGGYVIDVAYEYGFPIIGWNIDTLDWYYRCAEHTARYMIDNATNRAIILAHDTVRMTPDSMEYAIPVLIEMGFQLVTVSELFYHSGILLRPGMVYSNAW